MVRRSFVWLMAFALIVGMASAFAQKQNQRKRPARKARTQDTRVYLVHADVLHFGGIVVPSVCRGHDSCSGP